MSPDPIKDVDITVGTMQDTTGTWWVKLELTNPDAPGNKYGLVYTRDQAAQLIELLQAAVAALDARNN